MHINLENKHILVTGASRGIGKAIGKQLLESGATVGLHYHQNKAGILEMEKEFPGKAFGFQANLSDVGEVNKLFEEVISTLGQCEVLINNAAIALQSDFEDNNELWLSEWQQTMQVNLTSSAFLSKLFVNQLLDKQHEGSLVFISSRAAFRGDTAEYMAYAASKAGMMAYSHSIARAYGKQGIKSFVIAPGFVRTDMAQDFMDEYGEDYVLNDIILPKLTEPEDIANMVVFLASGLADHATGTAISINAGSYIR